MYIAPSLTSKTNIMKTFKDLEFKAYGSLEGSVHAEMQFDNGSWISVFGGGDGQFLKGNGTTFFEIISNATEKTELGIEEGLTPSEVTERMRCLQFPSLTSKTNDMTKAEQVQKAKDLLRSVGYHVSWWSIVDVTDDYDVSSEEARHCLESVLHGEYITEKVKEEIHEFAYENDYKENN